LPLKNNKVKKFLFSCFLLSVSIFGQPNQRGPSFRTNLPFESETISIPRIDGEFSVYFTYRMPYKFLVFEREDHKYNAGFRVIVEISDDNSNLIVRDIKDSKISVDNFELTNDKTLSIQDYLTFKLKSGEYKIDVLISDLNSTGELPLKPEKLNLSGKEDKKVENPLIIKAQEINCSDRKAFLLANSGGSIPFSNEVFNLVIPVRDTSVENLTIKIENNDENIFSGVIDESYIIPIGITMCENNLVVTSDSANILFRNFVLRNVNAKLTEGKLVLNISNEEKEIDKEYESQVVWFNKPFSLRDPEKAIEFLSYIESDSVISSMLDEDESDYSKILNDFWKKFDPTPETAYNEIMFEYYSRIDYAMREFRGISKDDGAKTDRGMIYIRFGKPDKIMRSSNPEGQIIEIWTYLNPEKKFSFVDKKGTGNFTLIEE
jgi:GWxTD domain-containing protein